MKTLHLTLFFILFLSCTENSKVLTNTNNNIIPNQELTLINQHYCENISSLYQCYLKTREYPHVIRLKDSILVADFHSESIELYRVSKNKFATDGLEISFLSNSKNRYQISINGVVQGYCINYSSFKNHIFSSIRFQYSKLFNNSNYQQIIHLKIINDSYAEVEENIFEYSIQTDYTTDTVEYDRVLFINSDSLFLCRMTLNNNNPILFIE